MKKLKLFITTVFFLLFSFKTTAKPIDNIKQFTLENGMEIFLLEDSSDALVHIEYACRAGYSSQSRDNCGFFKLYTNLVKTNNQSLNFTDVQCNQDSSRYLLTVTAPQTEYTLTKLSDALFAPQFPDELITIELEKLQNEIKDTTEDMSKYINSAIESKVFKDSPWKHDSGIYPPVFRQITTNQARVQIKNISENWYTPQNSALFICGNINIEKLLIAIENTFGKYYSSVKVPEHEVSLTYKEKKSENKKFILHSPELSQELTQVTVQYKTLNMIETKLLAEILNNNNSSFKNNLLSLQSLNIPGDEYIDITSNQQRDNSRLIIQTLIQPPALQNNKNIEQIETTSINQAIEFYTHIKNIPDFITEEEIKMAQISLVAEMSKETKDSVNTMNALSSFWAIAPYYQTTESDFQSYPDSVTTSLMMSQIVKLLNIDFTKVKEHLISETPYIFVIINSEDYNKNKTAYTIAGFEEITPENASWYVQEMNKQIQDRLNIEEKPEYADSSSSSLGIRNNDNQYYEKNLNQIKEKRLQNGIRVVTKSKPDSADISLLISISGGKLKSADDNGFEELMINILTSMIKDNIKTKQSKGIIKSAVEISSETKLASSYILIEFRKGATEEILKTIKDIIIYGDIPPATADKAVSHLRYKKRLANGSVKNQMYSEVIKQLYGQGDLYNIFESKNEILTKTTYMSILAEYHSLLDTSRYSIIISGDFEKNIIELLENTMGTISIPKIESNDNNSKILKENITFAQPSFPANKKVTIDLTHTFLTDIPAEEAGPQPAVLVPTTEFLDPVMYVIEAPAFGTRDSALFSAMLKYFEKQLENNIKINPLLQNCTVSIELPENRMNFATVIFQNVSHINEIDSIYKSTLNNIMENLSIQRKKEITLQNIKDNWTLTQLKTTNTNTGTVKLIHEGFEQFITPEPGFYLNQYNYIQQATVRDFERILNYLLAPVKLKIYSTSSKL